MNGKRIWPLAAVLTGIALYVVLFYATKLPGFNGIDGQPLRRAIFLLFLLTPEDLVSQWFGAEGAFAIGDRLPLLAAAGGIVAYAFSLGWMLIVLTRVDRWLDRLETFVFSTAVGLNVVSTYVLLAGLAGLLDNRLVFAVPATLTLAVAGRLRFGRKTQSEGERSDTPPEDAADDGLGGDAADDGLSPAWLWLTGPFVLVMLLGAMLPPAEYDVREYHLQAPKEFFEAGRIGFLPHNAYGNMALGTEMLSLLGMVIAGDWWLGALIGKTVIAIYAPLTALGLLAAGKRFFRPTVGIVAAVLYLTTPWVVQLSTVGFVEGASGLYLLMTLYALLLWNQTPQRPAALLLLAGYLAGSAVSCKYPAVLFVVFPLALWLGAVLFGKPGLFGKTKALGRSKAVAALGIFFLAIVVACGPWFGKNLAFTGNPTYPLMYRLFGGKTWTAEKAQMWNDVHQPTDFSASALKHDLARVLWESEWLSPLLIPLAVLAFLRSEQWVTHPRKRRLAGGPVWGLAAYFTFIIVAWWCLALRGADRHWIHGLPLVALLAGVGACWSREKPWQWTLRGLLIFAAAANFVVVTSGACGYNRYFAPLRELRDTPERVDLWHRYFNRHVTGGVLLLVGEAQVFDIEVPILYNVWIDDSIFERLVRDPITGKLRAADEIRAAFAEENISRVYVYWKDIARYRDTGYGSMDFVEPSVFDQLVDEGILQPIPPPEGLQNHPGRAYRVSGFFNRPIPTPKQQSQESGY